MIGRLASVAVLAPLLALAGASPATAFVACAYDAGTHTATASVSVDLGDGDSNRVYRSSSGEILTNTAGGAATPCGAATVTNTDTIVLVDGSPGGSLHGQSPTIASDLAPGFTDEPGNSDEIELVIDFGAGSDGIFLEPADRTAPTPADPGPHSIAVGTPAGMPSLVNINATEAGGVDADVSMTGVDFVSVFLFPDSGADAGDTIRADGSAATGGAPFAGELNVDGGLKADTIVGGDGADNLDGNAGDDDMDGGGGRDEVDGGNGDDIVAAGPGNDSYTIGATGDDVLKGGPGNDFRLLASGGNDSVFGGPGKDKLYGENGTDRVAGGPGRGDVCDGGASHDDVLGPGCETSRPGDANARPFPRLFSGW